MEAVNNMITSQTQPDVTTVAAGLGDIQAVRAEVGALIRRLIDGDGGKPFSAVATEAQIASFDLSQITRGRADVRADQLDRLLAVLGVTQDAFLEMLSSAARAAITTLYLAEMEEEDSLAAADDGALIPADEPPVAPARAGKQAQSNERPAVGMQQSSKRQVGSKQQPSKQARPDRARAERRGVAENKQLRWGEPSFPGELTYYSIAESLGPEFTRGQPGGPEIVFTYNSSCDIEVRVYTSLAASTGRARPIGEDAIRIVVFDLKAKRKIGPWSTKMNRVGDCLGRLEAAVGQALLRAKKRPTCIKCQSPMKICGKSESVFWGCSSFPACKAGRALNLNGRKPSSPPEEDAAGS